jgi:DNA-binding NarL/FixJ family response regulator
MPAPFKILIADDSQVLRRALGNLIKQHFPDSLVCGEAVDGEDAIQKVEELHPDVVLLDLSIPRLNGVQVAENLKKAHPSLKILLMSEQSSETMQHLAEKMGVRGIPKSQLATELPSMLRVLAEEDSLRNQYPRS